MKFRVLVNAGGAKIYLQQTAQDLNNHNTLFALISGIIFAHDSKIRRYLGNSKNLNRIFQRSGELSNQKLIRISFLGEISWQLAVFLEKRLKKQFFPQLFFWVSSILFANTAKRMMRLNPQKSPIIYHVRSGFGGSSIMMAKKLGYKVVVDHSIAHPDFLRTLQKNTSQSKEYVFSMDNRIRRDLNMAELVVVNSDFVAETFLKANFQGKIRVAIPPIEKSFSNLLRGLTSPRSEVSFIGRCEYRKGIDVVLEIVQNLDPEIRVNIVGNWDIECHQIRGEFGKLPNVTLHSYLDMAGVVDILSRTRIFLFPSRAEGAARVVGEAMHAGCAVFSTLEAGVPVPAQAGYLINDLSIQDIHRQIELLLNNDLKFKLLSSNARIHISALEERYLSVLQEIYEEVLEV